MYRNKRGARHAGLTVYPRKSKFGLRHTIKLTKLALLRDEVRILIFDDPAELAKQKRPKFCSAQLDSTRTAVCHHCQWKYSSNVELIGTKLAHQARAAAVRGIS